MQGILTITKTNMKYLIRNDSGYGNDIWAWDIYQDAGLHVAVTKWKKLPKGKPRNHVELFDLDDPPRTVSWQPLLD